MGIFSAVASRTRPSGPQALSKARSLIAPGATLLALLALGQAAAQQNPATVNALWVAESAGVLKVATADGRLLIEIPGLTNVRAVAVDHHRPTIWLYAGQNLYAYGYDGHQEIVLPVALPDPSRAALAVNEHDGSIWLGAGPNLVSASAAGQRLPSLRLAGDIRSLGVDPAGARLWVGTSTSAAAYDAISGALILSLDLGANPDLRSLVLDPSGKVWVALRDGVRRYAADGSLLAAVAVKNPTALAGDSHDGAWVTTDQDLLRVAPDGQIAASLAAFDGRGKIGHVVLDPSNDNAWLANEKAVAQVDTAGHLVRAFEFQPPVHIWDLALYADVIPPELQFTAPADGAFLNSKTPTLAVSYSDVGSGVNPATLAFAANGIALPASCAPAGAGASCAILTPLAEGLVTVTATVKDYAGNVSQPAQLSFTVDTIPPTVTITSPASGLLTNQRQLTVTGAVSEPATVTVGGVPAVVGANLAFAQSITLQEGPNAIVVAATDRAGNQGKVSVSVTLDTIPPKPVDPQRVTVTTPSGGLATVSAGPGSAEPAATVLLTDLPTGATAGATVTPDGSFSMAISCHTGDSIQIVLRDAAGNASTPVTVIVPGPTGNGLPPDPSTVATPIDRTVPTDIAAATAFLYTGSNPIQQGVRSGAVDPFVVAVLRGSVHDRSGQSLPGVTVTVLGHPELGSTLTRADGLFDLVANGGGLVTLQFDKSGYLSAQRQVQAPWRDYAWLEDVVLVQLDSAATFVDTSLTAMQVVRGTAVADGNGSRRATLLFPAGTTAQLVLPGGPSFPLSTLTVRATEYTVGAGGPRAMPAQLPATIAYTYAVELTADEASPGSKVQFSQPVPFYVENFLGFPVGALVPSGYYDMKKGLWVGSDDGRVVGILSVTGGLADLDVAGTGVAATSPALAALGISDDERRNLAALYAVGQSLWRAPLQHFTVWDFNFSPNPPPDAVPPPDPDDNPPPDPPDPCEEPGGSVIGCETQALGEDLPIVGTPFTLHYQSDRLLGRHDARSVHVHLSGPTPPGSLVRIDLQVTIAGRRFLQSFSPAPNLATTFEWDGTDGYGRLLQGEYPATVTVSYIYHPQYLYYTALPPGATFSWGVQLPVGFNANLIATLPRFEYAFKQTFTRLLGGMDATAERLGGWTLDQHHDYDASTRTVWRGDGGKENGDPIGTSAMALLAVTPLESRRLRLNADGSLDVVAAGFFCCGGEIDHVDRSGALQLTYSNAGENVFIYDATRDPLGQLFFVTCSSSFNAFGPGSEIRAVRDLFTSQVVVSLPQISCGTVSQLVSDRAGGFYLAGDIVSGFNRVSGALLHAGHDGSVVTLVSSQALPQFSAISVELAADGSLYVGDFGGRVFRLSPTGDFRVIAGTGTRGFSGDGGPAIAAQLAYPVAITAGLDGTLWVTDRGRLRVIDPTGVIKTIAGGGVTTPDVGLSPFATSFFSGVAIDPNRVLYFVDGNQGVWRIDKPFPGYSANDFVVASSDAREAYVFSANGRHLRTVDPVTGAVLYSFTYNGSNLVTAIQDRDGLSTQIERDAQGNALAIVSPDGQRTTLALGTDGYLATFTNPAGEARGFTYTAGGLLATQTDPRGFQSSYHFSADGRLISDVDAAGGFKNLVRTAYPRFSSMTMTTGAGNSYQYTVQYPPSGGRLRLFTGADGLVDLSQIAPDGKQTSTSPDGTVVTTTLDPDPRFGLQSPVVTSESTRLPSGLTRSVSGSRSAVLGASGDPLSLSTQSDSWTVNGKTFVRFFDRSQMRWTFQTPTGRLFITTVSSAGRPTSFQVGNLAATQFTYDTAGRLISATQGAGTTQRTMSLAYGTDGRLRSITDPLQHTSLFAWDVGGRLTSEAFADGRIVGFTYDPAGNLISVTPPGRPSHRFTFTPVDLQQSYTPPDLGTGPNATTNSYDLDRRLTAISRPDGRTVLFNYQLGRLASVNFDRGTISFTYDATTSLLQAVSAPGGETVAYTSDGPLPTRTTWSGPVAGSVERSFNQDFKVSAETVNGQLTAMYQYDSDGLLIQAGAMSISRDPSTGLMTGTTLGSLTTSEVRNSFGEPSSYSASYAGTEFFRVDFTRDAGGRIVRKVETISGTTSTYDYVFDVTGRLTDVSLNGAALSHYSYDANSNRTSVVEGSTTTTAVYDAQDRLLTSGNLAYSYNANGDLTSKAQNGNTVTYAYDALGNLVTVVAANGIQTEYILDGQKRRVGKMVGGILVQGLLWLDRSKIAAELDGAGNTISRFVYAKHDNTPDLILKNGITYQVIKDHLGGPRLVVDAATGQIAQRLDYDAWGRVILNTNPGFQPFGFAGGLYDAGAGLVRFGARDYDAAVGRWTARDPILFGGGDTNLYGYVVSDPVDFTDPRGLDTFECRVHLGNNDQVPRGPDDDWVQSGLYHEYLCVTDANHRVSCGGQGNTGGNWSWDKWFHKVPGVNDSRKFDAKKCKRVDNRQCVDKCVKAFIDAPRPPFSATNADGGLNCQAWATAVVDICKSRCPSQ